MELKSSIIIIIIIITRKIIIIVMIIIIKVVKGKRKSNRIVTPEGFPNCANWQFSWEEGFKIDYQIPTIARDHI